MFPHNNVEVFTAMQQLPYSLRYLPMNFPECQSLALYFNFLAGSLTCLHRYIEVRVLNWSTKFKAMFRKRQLGKSFSATAGLQVRCWEEGTLLLKSRKTCDLAFLICLFVRTLWAVFINTVHKLVNKKVTAVGSMLVTVRTAFP